MFRLTFSLNIFKNYRPMSNEIQPQYLSTNLIYSALIANKYDCFNSCTANQNCSMVYYGSNQCNLYDRIDFNLLSYPTSNPMTLFQQVPEFE